MSGEHRAYRDDLAAYALDALDTSERIEIERHIDGCEQCREYLTWLDPATDLLPMSVEQLDPPGRVKRALMDAVREDVKTERRAERQRKRSERGVWGSIWRPVTAVAATTVLVAGVVVGYAVRGDDGGAKTTTFQVQSTNAGVGAEMEATLERAGDRGTLHVVKLPGLPSDENYQAWIQRDGVMEPSTTFVVRKDGSNEVAIDGSLDGAQGVYITREPEGGSERPTSPVIMGASLN